MNCREFQRIAMPLARGETLAEAAREEGFAHAESCPRCADRLLAERRLTAAFAGAATAARGQRAPARVERELRRSFRVQRGPSRITRNLWGWAAWAAGAAAAVLIAAVLMFQGPLVRRVPKEPATRIEKHSEPSPPVVTAAVTAPQTKSAAPRTGIRRVVRANGETEFVRLPYAPEAEPEGEAYIARVRLSRAALAAAGLPMNMDKDEDAVEADVLVGEDGSARAVRMRQ
jgi:hypothetical protein